MKQNWLYVWYPLFQVQWDIYDQHNRLAHNYLNQDGECRISQS